MPNLPLQGKITLLDALVYRFTVARFENRVKNVRYGYALHFSEDAISKTNHSWLAEALVMNQMPFCLQILA